MKETVSNLVEKVEIFSVKEKGSTIHEYFENNPSSKGIVIIEDADKPYKPIGLIMRNHFYQMIANKF